MLCLTGLCSDKSQSAHKAISHSSHLKAETRSSHMSHITTFAGLAAAAGAATTAAAGFAAAARGATTVAGGFAAATTGAAVTAGLVIAAGAATSAGLTTAEGTGAAAAGAATEIEGRDAVGAAASNAAAVAAVCVGAAWPMADRTWPASFAGMCICLSHPAHRSSLQSGQRTVAASSSHTLHMEAGVAATGAGATAAGAGFAATVVAAASTGTAGFTAEEMAAFAGAAKSVVLIPGGRFKLPRLLPRLDPAGEGEPERGGVVGSKAPAEGAARVVMEAETTSGAFEEAAAAAAGTATASFAAGVAVTAAAADGATVGGGVGNSGAFAVGEGALLIFVRVCAIFAAVV